MQFDQGNGLMMNPDELRSVLEPIWTKIHSLEPESVPFRQPVDPIALGIPDYFRQVKCPMDLSAIKQKLISNQYGDPWPFIDDFNQMFDNSIKYNRKTTLVYRYTIKVRLFFLFDILRFFFHTYQISALRDF